MVVVTGDKSSRGVKLTKEEKKNRYAHLFSQWGNGPKLQKPFVGETRKKFKVNRNGKTSKRGGGGGGPKNFRSTVDVQSKEKHGNLSEQRRDHVGRTSNYFLTNKEMRDSLGLTRRKGITRCKRWVVITPR